VLLVEAECGKYQWQRRTRGREWGDLRRVGTHPMLRAEGSRPGFRIPPRRLLRPAAATVPEPMNRVAAVRPVAPREARAAVAGHPVPNPAGAGVAVLATDAAGSRFAVANGSDTNIFLAGPSPGRRPSAVGPGIRRTSGGNSRPREGRPVDRASVPSPRTPAPPPPFRHGLVHGSRPEVAACFHHRARQDGPADPIPV
jgi:hypothetical protein